MTLKEYKAMKMKDPEFAAAYAEIQPEMQVIRAMIDAQTEISKLENGTRNPSIRLLQRLADGMGMVLQIAFIPKEMSGSAEKIES